MFKTLGKSGFIATALVALAYTLAYTAITWTRHANFNSSIYDLGLFDQIIWNIGHGRFFESSIKGFNYLGDHFSPILVFLAPIYWIWDDVRMLLLFQAAAIAVSAFPFAAIASETLKSRFAGVALSAVFLLHPSLGYTNIFDFHPEILLVPLFTFAFYFLRHGGINKALLCILLALMVKEEVAITVGAFGVYIFFFHSKKAGALVAIASVVWFFLVMNVLIPSFKPSGAEPGFLYNERYEHLGSSMPEILKNAVIHPVRSVSESYVPWKGVTFLRMFLPTGFLAFAGLPVLLITAPAMWYTFISKYAPQFDVRFQYLTICVPFIMLAMLDGLKLLSSLIEELGKKIGRPRLNMRSSAMVLALALILLNTFSVYWIYRTHYLLWSTFKPAENSAATREAMALIPSDASLATVNLLGPHLSHRRDIEFAVPFDPHWYHYEKLHLPLYSNAQYQLFNTKDVRWTRELQPSRINTLKNLLGYETIFEKDGILLLRSPSWSRSDR
ncbi:MAG: DUF2079 domain-containing protein [Myxococcota bacterium]|jgi:uncharacterized membrane protein